MQTVELGEKCREMHGVLDGRLYYTHYQSKGDPHAQNRPVLYLHPLLTEFYASYTWSVDLCRAMAQFGMSVVRVEPQGHGNTGGEIAYSNLNELGRDYKVGLDYLLRECDHPDTSRLIIVGCRLGANMGLWLAARQRSELEHFGVSSIGRHGARDGVTGRRMGEDGRSRGPASVV